MENTKYKLTVEEAKVAIAYSKSGDREQISRVLNKSVNTVKAHQRNIYKKMGLTHKYRKRNSLIESISEFSDIQFDSE